MAFQVSGRNISLSNIKILQIEAENSIGLLLDESASLFHNVQKGFDRKREIEATVLLTLTWEKALLTLMGLVTE